ncbi:hypothetical protein H9P43_005880 [Blastocladiella emersonii ATCC 22665]|nr:hypothetical protein H9P43_005880 [Blastocladiella emersonii ATCC 22665]
MNRPYSMQSSERCVWTSPPFPQTLGGRLVGVGGENFKAMERAFPGLRFQVFTDRVLNGAGTANGNGYGVNGRRMGRGNSPGDENGTGNGRPKSPATSGGGPSILRIYAKPGVHPDVPARARLVLEQVLNHAQRTFDIKLVLCMVVPTDAFALQWEYVPGGENYVGVLDSPPPYYRAVPARPGALPLNWIQASGADVYHTPALGPQPAKRPKPKFGHRQQIAVLTREFHDEIVTTLAKRRAEVLDWAAPRAPKGTALGAVLKLKASLGNHVFARSLMSGRIAEAAPRPELSTAAAGAGPDVASYSFTFADLATALRKSELKSSFNPALSPQTVVNFTSLLESPAAGFVRQPGTKYKVLVKFTLPWDLGVPVEQYRPRRQYRATFLCDPAAAAAAGSAGPFVVKNFRVDPTPLNKYSIVVPGSDTGFRLRQTVQTWDVSTEDGSIHPAATAVARRLLAYLNETANVLVHIMKHTVRPDCSVTVPSLPVDITGRCHSISVRTRVVTTYARGPVSVSVSRATAIVDTHPLSPTQTLVRIPHVGAPPPRGECAVTGFYRPCPTTLQVTARRDDYAAFPIDAMLPEGHGDAAERAIKSFLALIEVLVSNLRGSGAATAAAR